MTVRLFVNTNILIYALDPAEPVKRATSADLLRRTINNHTLVLSPQNLNECYQVLIQLFISEDMQDGQLISGMRIVNPFSPDFSKRIAAQ